MSKKNRDRIITKKLHKKRLGTWQKLKYQDCAGDFLSFEVVTLVLHKNAYLLKEKEGALE